MLQELSTVTIGRAPDLRPGLRARLDEAVPVLREVLADGAYSSTARDRALRLLYHFEVPGTDDAVLAIAKKGDGTPGMIEFLGRRCVPGSGDVLLELFHKAEESRETALEALAYMGDSRAIPLVRIAQEAFDRWWIDRRESLLRSGEDPDGLAGAEAARREHYDRLRRFIEIAHSTDPVTAAVPLLFDPSSESRGWALTFLRRKQLPALALHLRSAFDVLKRRPRWTRSMDIHHEWEMLRALSDAGGPLTPGEVAFLDQYENARGCDMPLPAEVPSRP